jgi:hypothetical protein
MIFSHLFNGCASLNFKGAGQTAAKMMDFHGAYDIPAAGFFKPLLLGTSKLAKGILQRSKMQPLSGRHLDSQVGL